MVRLGRWICLVLAGAGLPLPAAAAMPVQESKIPTQAVTSSEIPNVCLADVFYGPLPGRANYCLGLRDWRDGHYSSGLELIKLAAGWGNKSAQYTLGLIYYGGHHVATNPVRGMAWLKLANERANDAQVKLATRSAWKLATPAQRAGANALYDKMLATYGDHVAAARAWQHLQHWKRRHSRNNGNVCLTGAELYEVQQLGIASVNYTVRYALVVAADRGMHPTNPYEGGAAKAQAACFGLALQVRHEVVQKTADEYFHGWMGTVSVGPLKQVPAPASSSKH